MTIQLGQHGSSSVEGGELTPAQETKLNKIQDEATKNQTDAHLLARENHTGTQGMATVEGLDTALGNKVDKVAGKGLSDTNYTQAEKDKLAGLESSRFKGQYTSLTALQTAHPTATAGDYANVDEGVGSDVVRYAWDSSDLAWVKQLGESSQLTASQIKQEYESNLDTNAYTDSEKTKLSEVEAQANNYAHPASHPPSIITQDENNRFATDVEKTAWNAKETPSGAQTKVNTLQTNLEQKSPSILVVDQLRKSVESESGGRQTVIYTAKGQPNFMYVLPKFNMEDIPGWTAGTGTHPAFLFDGVADSEILIGVYQAAEINGEAISQPLQVPRIDINYDQARSLCQANGTGWDLMTVWDWAAIVLWCMANGYQPLGNTDHGRHHSNRWETGRRQDNGVIGSSSGTGNILTGSGPKSWRHDNSPAGISDLVGNVWELQSGFKIVDGRAFLAADNAIPDESSYVDTGFDMPSTQTWSAVDASLAPDSLKQALIVPNGAADPIGRLLTDLTGERLPCRGGDRYDDSNAGLAALAVDGYRTSAVSYVGLRARFRNQ